MHLANAARAHSVRAHVCMLLQSASNRQHRRGIQTDSAWNGKLDVHVARKR